MTGHEYTLTPSGALVRVPSSPRVVVRTLGGDLPAVLVCRAEAPSVDPASISRVLRDSLVPQVEVFRAPTPPEEAAPLTADTLMKAMAKVMEAGPQHREPVALPQHLFDVYARAFADSTGTDADRHGIGLRAVVARAVSDSVRAHDARTAATVARARTVHNARTTRTDERAHAHDPLAVFVIHDAHEGAPPTTVDAPPMRLPVRFVGGPLHGRTGHALTTVDAELRQVPPRFVGVPLPMDAWADPSTVQMYVRTRPLDCGAWAFEWRPRERAHSRQVLHRRDLPDTHVLAHALRSHTVTGQHGAIGALMTEGVPHNLAYAKVMHLVDRGLLDYGTSPYSAWPTGAGRAALRATGRDA